MTQLNETILPFWGELSPEEQAGLNAASISMSHPKGALLHRADQECLGLLYVEKGQLRTYILSEEGREVTLFRVRDRELCVMAAGCLMDSIVFDVQIEAIENTTVIVIPTGALAPVLEKHPRAEVMLYKAVTERFAEVMWTMQQILFMGADRRVAIFLWDEMSRTGDPVLHLSHEEIAQYIGSAREVVTKVLRYFAEEGVVALGRRKVEIIDREKLRRYL